jgi:heme exporter protein D
MAFATEAITELVVKSMMFAPIRALVSRLGNWVEELFKCGYCFSVWVAFGVTILSQHIFPFTGLGLVGFFLTAVITHRLSNIIHNIIDKWTDKYYSITHINTDKG